MIGAVVLQVVLIALNAVFASAEIAVISLNGTKLEKMSEEGDRRARRLAIPDREPGEISGHYPGGYYAGRIFGK